MEKLIQVLPVFHAIVLFLLSAFFFLLLLASGHRISFHDSTQMKFIFEIILFAMTAVFLLLKEISIFTKWTVVILLVLVQISFLDIYFEITYDEDDWLNAYLFLFVLLFGINLLLIYLKFKSIFKR